MEENNQKKDNYTKAEDIDFKGMEFISVIIVDENGNEREETVRVSEIAGIELLDDEDSKKTEEEGK